MKKLLPNLKKKLFLVLLSVSVASVPLSAAKALDLSNTVYGEMGNAAQIDPLLLFAVSLGESAYGDENTKYQGKTGVRPNAYTLRSKQGPYYSSDKSNASQELYRRLAQTSNVDIGAMQISWLWHGKGLKERNIKPDDLLDLKTNVSEGARILKLAMNSMPNDLELGVGRYHNWSDEDLARNYGQRILAIYNNLKKLSY